MSTVRPGLRGRVVAVAWLLPVLLAAVPRPARADADAPQTPARAASEARKRWGDAVKCKPLAGFPRLADPDVVISLDGLTLHLFDRASAYDKVFPVGLGVVKKGRTLTHASDRAREGEYWARLDQPEFTDKPAPEVRWAWNYRCRFWWHEPGTGRLLPVYAGMPYIRLDNGGLSDAGIHGPAERYTERDGGKLRRGYVSHGCIRMDTAGIQELYGRTSGHRFPVRIQREVERRADGTAVDVVPRGMLGECRVDADCGLPGAICHAHPAGGAGFCTMPCDGTCAGVPGEAPTVCVPDPTATGGGICTVHALPFNNLCRRYPGFVRLTTTRFGPGRPARVDACVPRPAGADRTHASNP